MNLLRREKNPFRRRAENPHHAHTTPDHAAEPRPNTDELTLGIVEPRGRQVALS